MNDLKMIVTSEKRLPVQITVNDYISKYMAVIYRACQFYTIALNGNWPFKLTCKCAHSDWQLVKDAWRRVSSSWARNRALSSLRVFLSAAGQFLSLVLVHLTVWYHGACCTTHVFVDDLAADRLFSVLNRFGLITWISRFEIRIRKSSVTDLFRGSLMWPRNVLHQHNISALISKCCCGLPWA